ncbi:glycosyltransferase [Cytobacillus firmus]|uniref:glycosyltransferase family 2 protein n=1 Tax=Cytobacillus firmus TaxID=1399 RepID=UPI001C9710CC|nr:glycosyltransferase [Cytobacillus firmus]MBY6053362.1 glycosyltransferase [Cytobacillus firmus]USK41225.1 glycosyltransferase [Cytobacillus firmus]
MSVSLIFPVKNEGDNVKKTLDSLFTKKTNTHFEVIVVDDGSTDDGCTFLHSYPHRNSIQLITTDGIGAANARNAGANAADGDFLVFCDAHLQFEDWWIDHLLDPILRGLTDAVSPAIGSMGNDNFIGYGQSLKPNFRIKWNAMPENLNETAILPGACLGITKKVFEDIGGFEKRFKTWGHEDVEISIKLWLFGYRCHVLPSVKILHLFRKTLPYNVSYQDVYYNLMWIAYSHFNARRILKCRKLILDGKAGEIEERVLDNGALIQRKDYFSRRKREDNWYFNKFQIDF